MNLNDYDRKKLDDFLLSIEPILAGYKHASFSYFALKQESDFVLSQDRLHLSGVPIQVPSGHFEYRNIKAGNFSLNESNQTPQVIIESLLSGKLLTPHGELNFPEDQNHKYSTYFDPFHQDGIQSQLRQMQLVISAGSRPRIFSSMEIDWELKAAPTPYESVQDLCNEYAVGPISGEQIRVEVVANNLAAVDAGSFVKETKAHLTMLLADGLDRNKASIGFRVFDKNKVKKRGHVLGINLIWTKTESIQRGAVEIEVPSGAVLHCFANYAGVAHHHFWVTDPSTAPNPRRAVHQAFDDKLEILQELLKTQGKGRDIAHDFESAIAWLLWMLGFSVTHIGGTQKTSDASDLIATTPQGHFLVIECTTGLLKAENKLPNLIDRAEKVRRSLANSGNGHLRVMPVIVTNKTREEIKADLEQAEKLGVLVGTREGFVNLINLTHVAPDPDQLYKQAEDEIRRAQNPDPLMSAMGR